MSSKSKLALVAVIAAVSMASPAFAQAVDHTGTLAASYYDTNGKQVIGSWAPGANAPRAAAPKVANRYEHDVQGRGLYASTVVPSVSGYDGSIETQR